MRRAPTPDLKGFRLAKPRTQSIRTEGRFVMLRNDQICEARSAAIAGRIAECLRAFAGLKINDRRPNADEPRSVQRILSRGDGLCAVVSAAFERRAIPPAFRSPLRAALCEWWEERGNFVEAKCKRVENANPSDHECAPRRVGQVRSGRC